MYMYWIDLFCFFVPVIVVEGVVVLKEVVGYAIFCIELMCIVFKWHFSWYCFSHKSCRIWKTLDDVPSDVLILKWVHFLLSQCSPLGN